MVGRGITVVVGGNVGIGSSVVVGGDVELIFDSGSGVFICTLVDGRVITVSTAKDVGMILDRDASLQADPNKLHNKIKIITLMFILVPFGSNCVCCNQIFDR